MSFKAGSFRSGSLRSGTCLGFGLRTSLHFSLRPGARPGFYPKSHCGFLAGAKFGFRAGLRCLPSKHRLTLAARGLFFFHTRGSGPFFCGRASLMFALRQFTVARFSGKLALNPLLLAFLTTYLVQVCQRGACFSNCGAE